MAKAKTTKATKATGDAPLPPPAKVKVQALVYPDARQLETIGPDDVAWSADRFVWGLDNRAIVRVQPPANVDASKVDAVIESLATEVAAVKKMPAPRAATVVVSVEPVKERTAVSVRGVIDELLGAPMGADRDKVRRVVAEVMDKVGL